MTKNPVTIQAEDTIREASRIIREKKIGGLPVMDKENLIGMITESDILALLSVKGPSEDLWLPSPLEVIEIPIREFFNWEKTKEALSDIGSRPVRSVMRWAWLISKCLMIFSRSVLERSMSLRRKCSISTS
ncbi:MAG: CBS domain-containing protein [Desulfomonilia bacterium]|nr:CBS domain-containing protein [Desulfomonilia bacterium]